MAKMPKIPKSLPKKPVAKTPPFVARQPRPAPAPAPKPQKPRSTTPKYNAPSAVKSTPYVPPPPRPTSDQLEEAAEETKRKAKVTRWRQTTLLICGLAASGLGFYVVQLWMSLTKEPDWNDIPNDLSDRFDKEAGGYDEKVNTAETMLGLTSKRRAITERVKGHVLEVAVGTGRNISFYPTKKCDTVTLLDSSGPMLAVAKRKWKDTHPEYFSRVFFKQQSALDPITPPYGAQDGYDTVIQTMGLCSTPEPERLLHSLEAATKEDGGQILLLEHGKSHYQWLNDWLDKSAPSHAMEHGCWWNKDIGKIVEDSGLEVVDIKRYNFGTTWWVELKPRKGMRSKQMVAKAVEGGEPHTSPATPVTQKTGWSLWG